MGSEILQPDSGDDAVPAPTQEVEFALMLSRVIDSVKENPEFLRATVYELARHKLNEQFKSESVSDMRKLSKSLEVAIQGVEAFSRKKEGPETALPAPEAARDGSRLAADVLRQDVGPFVQPALPSANVGDPKKRPDFKVTWPFAAVIAVALAAASGAVSFDLLVRKGIIVVNQPASAPPTAVAVVSPQPAPTAADTKVAAPSPLLPTSFGIFAVSQDKLYELDSLPGRAPDMRIAISALITTPSRATLPDGHLSFVVYRRDSATSAADRAEVRLIARIAREASFDKDGKQVVTELSDNWVMRNISIPYRTAPYKDNPDMYEVRSENPEIPLAPGRYALVLKGSSYNFSVAGPVTDPRQCLERLAAVNGQFYSECKKP
jgi:hypothetical protein